MSKQTQDTMLMVGALAGTVGFVGFVALMVLGGFAFSPALFFAILVAAVVAMVLLIGFHSKPELKSVVAERAQKASQSLKAATSSDSVVAAPVAATDDVAEAPQDVAETPQAATDDAPAPRRPEALAAPRDGGADDLKKIKGVGPKLEELCHSLGFYHFDQIAGWSETEVAWVDENLEGFKGRVTRDEWVAQAKELAAGRETEFSARSNGSA